MYRPSPGLIVAMVAIVLASTGTAIGAGLVTGKQIKTTRSPERTSRTAR